MELITPMPAGCHCAAPHAWSDPAVLGAILLVCGLIVAILWLSGRREGRRP